MLPLLSPLELTDESKVIWPKLRPLYEMKERQQLSDGEASALYVLIFMQHRFGARAFGGKKHSSLIYPERKRNALIPQLLTLPPKMKRLLPHDFDLIDLYQNFHLAHLSPRINQSMLHFMQGDWNFRLIHHVPSVHEVLKHQAQGERLVSMMLEESELTHYILEEKDAVNFLLHDLAHGERFFHGRHRDAQVGLFTSLLSAYEAGIFAEAQEQDHCFKEKLEYGLADMNTHPLHLLQYLKAICLEYFLRKGQDEAAYLKAQEVFLQTLPWPRTLQENVRKINTPSYTEEEALALENHLAHLGRDCLRTASGRPTGITL